MISINDICVAAHLLRDEGNVDVEDIAQGLAGVDVEYCGAAEPSEGMRELRSVIDGNHLDDGDLFYLLSHQEMVAGGAQVAAQRIIRPLLGYPISDPEGVMLSFKTANSALHTSGGQARGDQTAYVVVTPGPAAEANAAPLGDPVFIFTGLHHPSPLYLNTAVELAKREGRRVIVVDLPGMGGSRLADDRAIFPQDMFESAVSVIVAEVMRGQSFDVVSHSMGAVVASLLLRAGVIEGRRINRTVFVDPLPSEDQRAHGYSLRANYAKSAFFGALFGSVEPDRDDVLNYFMQEHPAERQQEFLRTIMRQRFHTNPLGAYHIFVSVINDAMSHIGRDENVRLIIGGRDNLFRLRNRDEWQGRRGVDVVEGGDHDFITEPSGASAISRALNGELNPNQPLLALSSMARRLSLNVVAGVGGNAAALGAALQLHVVQGVFETGGVIFGFGADAGALVGLSYGGDLYWLLRGEAGLSVRPTGHPIEVDLGASVERDSQDNTSLRPSISVRLNEQDIVGCETAFAPDIMHFERSGFYFMCGATFPAM